MKIHNSFIPRDWGFAKVKGKDEAVVVVSSLQATPGNLETLGKEYKELIKMNWADYSPVSQHFLPAGSAPSLGILNVQDHQTLKWSISSGSVG